MRFVFQDFELDPRTHELRRDGRPVAVQPKVFKLLLHLVMHRHRCVTNEELLSVLWPGESVSPASITSAIRSARRVLGDAGASQTAIRTVRGHGYRFVLATALKTRERESGPVPPAAPEGETAASDFVGRAGLLETLDEALRRMAKGHGRCLVLMGEPGIGKTRTLLELATRARERGALVWFARCLEGAGAPSFWPISQLVREAADDLGVERLRAAMAAGAADIAHGVPELRRWLGELPEPPTLGASSARFRFFDSFAAFIRRISAQHPLVLLFDDLQQADEPTVRLLAFLAQQLERARVLIAGATRPSEDRRVVELVRGLTQPASSLCIALPGFSEREVADYLAQRIGAPVPRPVVMQLQDQTAGNPLYLQQLVEGLHEPVGASRPAWEQLLVQSCGGGVGAAIARQLEVVSEPCRALLQTAAVLGRDFSLGLLIEVSGGQPDIGARERLLQLLTEARSAGLVFTLDGPTQYRFKHALVRDALYAQIPAERCLRLHQAAGLALEAQGAGTSSSQLAQLADHFARAAPLLSADRALRYTLAAAHDASAKLAYEEAAAQLDRALCLLELGAPDRHRRLELLLAKGEALYRATQPTAARRVLLEAAALARELGEHGGVVEAVMLTARSPEQGASDADLVKWLREALARLPPADPRRAELTALLAKALSYAREGDECSRLALAALAHARDASATQQTATLYACHQALAAPQHLPVRMQISDALNKLGLRLGDPVVLMHGAITQLWNGVERGHAEDVELAMSTMEALVPRLREPLFHWCASMYGAMCALVHGDLARAHRAARTALEYGTLVGEEFAQHAHATQLYGILILEGRFAEAEALAHRFCARFPALGSWRTSLAILHAERGHTAQARRVLADLVADDLSALRSEPYHLAALAPAARLCALVGDAELARPLYEAILPYADRCGIVAFAQTTHGPMSRMLGMLALRMGDGPRALEHLRDAIAHAERMRSPTFVSLSCASHAAALLQAGTPSSHREAQEVLARATRVAAASHLPGVTLLCERLAEQLAAARDVPQQPATS